MRRFTIASKHAVGYARTLIRGAVERSPGQAALPLIHWVRAHGRSGPVTRAVSHVRRTICSPLIIGVRAAVHMRLDDAVGVRTTEHALRRRCDALSDRSTCPLPKARSPTLGAGSHGPRQRLGRPYVPMVRSSARVSGADTRRSLSAPPALARGASRSPSAPRSKRSHVAALRVAGPRTRRCRQGLELDESKRLAVMCCIRDPDLPVLLLRRRRHLRALA
jgi:hypothetical protein